MLVQFLGWNDPLEEEMATHSSLLVWRIPWTEEPGGQQSIGLQRVGHDWSEFACMHTLVLNRGRYLWMHFMLCAFVLSCVYLFATTGAIAHQTPLSMEFSRQKYWVACHFLLHGIFPTQGLNPRLLCLLHWRVDSLPLSRLGSPFMNAVTCSQSMTKILLKFWFWKRQK